MDIACKDQVVGLTLLARRVSSFRVIPEVVLYFGMGGVTILCMVMDYVCMCW